MKKIIALAATLSIGSAMAEAVQTSYKIVFPVAGMNQSTNSEIQPPAEIPDLGARTFDCGLSFCYAVIDGQLYVVGEGSKGELGLGDRTDRAEWTAVDGFSNVTYINATRQRGFVVNNNELFVTGTNEYGSLGLPKETTVVDTWQSTGIFGVESVASDGYYSTGIIVNGELYVAGYNTYKSLGLGDTINRYEWVSTGLTNVSHASIGYAAGFAIVDGELWSTGLNTRIGTTSRSVWEPTGITGVSDVHGGLYSSYAISNGELLVTGYNHSGEVGLGHQDRVSEWVHTGITGVTHVAAQHNTAYYVKGGVVYAAGDGTSGHLVSPDTISLTWQATEITGVGDIDASYNNMVIAYTADGPKIAGVATKIPGIQAVVSEWTVPVLP